MRVLEDKRVIGVASIAIRNKESLCALRPLESTLVLETLRYPDEIRERELSLPNVLVNDRELKVAGTLVDALQEPFDPARYHDHYREALLELIESKTQGKQVVVPEAAAESEPVTDLMAALRASIEAAKQRKGEPTEEKAGARKTSARTGRRKRAA
jgi:DNA end-binding protein Ku